MAYTTINKSTDYFNTKLYTGNSTTDTAITGVGFQPDWLWVKSRGGAESHFLQDAVRGATKSLKSESSAAESTDAQNIKSFDSDGFTLGSNDGVNDSGFNYVAWNWKANGAGSANTDGTINSTVSVNTTAGFSIVKYTGTGSAGTIGHGLGVAPKMIIVKCLDTAKAWTVYHSALGSSAAIFLEQNSAATTSNTAYFNGTDPTTSVFSIGSSTNVTNNGDEFIAYCFSEKTGYSKFGSYVGNGSSTDGTFVYTGFKPAFVITKKSSGSEEWNINDTTRDSYGNPLDANLLANTSAAETDHDRFDAISNGFKIRTDSGQYNASGATYIYMAFGQSLVGSNNVPCTAR